MIKIGNAPVSYGAFEVTVGKRDGVPTATEVLDAVAAAGYEGIDLGPVGFLGLGPSLRAALETRGLLLTGGYVEVDVSADDAPKAGLAELAQVCDQFDAVASRTPPEFLPRPTVAIIGSPAASCGETDDQRWERIERTVGDVVHQCQVRGYEACLHNEVGTQLSGQDSVVRVLETTSAALCLDSGHLIAAGGDPVAILRTWRDRVSHVHLKDARLRPSGQPYDDAMQLWEDDAFCPLGAGAGQVDEVLAQLRASRYAGWIVVEQDVLPRDPAAYQLASAHQAQNRQYLRDRGW
jgi:inosose dehydratase